VRRSARVHGFELIVDDLDRAIALFVDVLGFQLHSQGPFALFAGHMAVVTDGGIAITLLQPTTTAGDQPVLPDRTPRLSQIVLGTADGSGIDVDAVVESGLAVTPTADGFYLTPESVGGALGIEVAVVVVSSDPDARA
jgi:catechol 2,3-dioxygenase-like lactoylglutathione lyase family enzyme